ncbi:hypothetical protein [Chromohalobacter canadensis]|uniref:hypothetical protein n=1 Tax=Chromohalobacter canadensis TaxID=141389 RepID=UPI00240F30AA|nr:hypothetical protein [Chromohalobacter canadensis]
MKRSFYRTPVALYMSASYYNEIGDYVEGYSEPYITRGNLQPFSGGNNLTFTQAGQYYTQDYKVLYLREYPNFPDVPEDQQDGSLIMYANGEWYQAEGWMDYTTPASGPKHFKFQFSGLGSAPDITAPTL